MQPMTLLIEHRAENRTSKKPAAQFASENMLSLVGRLLANASTMIVSGGIS
jgi:hypothetical protein